MTAAKPMNHSSKEKNSIELIPAGASGRQTFWFASLLAAFAPLVLVLLTRPDGAAESAWLSFLGNFHPIAVHFPIALVVVIPIIELIARRNRSASLRASIPILWGVALAGALLAPLLGWGLAATGASGPLVSQHMWAGAFVAPACFVRLHLS
ncbi:MAG: hypothetical protein AAF224_02040 [Pseudomonadota bacterium]